MSYIDQTTKQKFGEISTTSQVEFMQDPALDTNPT